MNNSHFKIIFAHGYTASHLENWYPKISLLLKSAGVDFSIPDLPGHKFPHSKKWLEIIHQECQKTNKPIVLVGHSLGTRAILLYLEQFQKQVEHVFLIAPLSNDLANAKRRGGEAYPDFFTHQIDLNKVKTLSKNWTILHSADDPSLDYQSHGATLSKEIGVELLSYQDKKHFCEAENAELIFEVIKKRLF
jgi:predicted alpha/beta hydrolase family esterase